MNHDVVVPLLRMSQISKSFPGTRALHNVSFEVLPGEVHCLLGENGAGKSTLMKILAGSYSPDSGDIYFGGEKVVFSGPADGIAAGIAVIYQELDLFPDLTVAQNIFLGHADSTFGFIKARSRKSHARMFIERVGGRFSEDDIVGKLPIADQQLTAIARALSMDAKLIVMDEPTATLGEADVDKVFAVVRSLVSEGRSVVYISHRLREVETMGGMITVLRDGQNAATYRVEDSNQQQWIADMIGEKRDQLIVRKMGNRITGDVVLEVESAQVAGLIDITDVSVRAGEVLGIAGLGGSGRTTLLAALYGSKKSSLRATLGGGQFSPRTVRSAVKAGVGLVPESRKSEGLFLGLSIFRNASIASIGRAPWLMPHSLGKALVQPVLTRLGVKYANGHQLVGELSGGNQQKVVLSKWLAKGIRLLLLDEPTRGLDIGAKAELYQQVRHLAENGAAVIVASSELSELVAYTDRIVVLHEGKNVAEFDPQCYSEETISQTIISGRVK